jgi:5-methyltetrahydrofolate--homocysteine methyltransferase
MIRAGLGSQEGRDGKALVAIDMGPIGELMEPLGDLTEEQRILFKEMAVNAEEAVRILRFRDMSDLNELLAAVAAVSENTACRYSLP